MNGCRLIVPVILSSNVAGKFLSSDSAYRDPLGGRSRNAVSSICTGFPQAPDSSASKMTTQRGVTTQSKVMTDDL